jgi:hypothetical protein
MKYKKKTVNFEPSSSTLNVTLNKNRNNLPNDNEQLGSSMILNPGIEYLLQSDDVCIYISLVKEQNFDWKNMKSVISKKKKLLTFILN